MVEETYNDLVLRGERVRETGDPLGAIPIFQQAVEKAKRPSQVSNAKRHMGLCYEHCGELPAAEILYNEALKIAQEAGDLGDMARTKRHLLSVELKRGRFEKALQLGKEARSHMLYLSTPPTDLVWVTHGIVKALIDGKLPKKEVREWARHEWNDLKCMWPIEKNPIRKRVWTTGWLMDASYAWAPWSWPLLPVAFLIAFFSGLKLRMNQMIAGKR